MKKGILPEEIGVGNVIYFIDSGLPRKEIIVGIATVEGDIEPNYALKGSVGVVKKLLYYNKFSSVEVEKCYPTLEALKKGTFEEFEQEEMNISEIDSLVDINTK